MVTISTVAKNLFTQTGLAELAHKTCRGSRRNLARIAYRKGRRPGLVNPVPDSELPPPSPRQSRTRVAQCVQQPMRHVYKLHEPPRGKLKMSDVSRLPRRV